MNNSEPDNYFTEIEAHFSHRRGRHLTVSPRDWQLIQRWQTRKIPLRVVLNAIDDVFSKRKSENQINSLSYCENAVESAFKQYAASRAGAHDDASDDGVVESSGESAQVAAALESLVENLHKLSERFFAEQNPVAPTIYDTELCVCKIFHQYRQHSDFARAENDLEITDLAFLLSLTNFVSAEDKKTWLDEIQATFAPSMPSNIRAETSRVLLANKIRAHFDAPKLTLFQ